MNEDEVARLRAAVSTDREQRFVRWALASREKATNLQAEHALRDALRRWEQGHSWLDPRDRDARLSLVQLELLHALARLGSVGTPAAELLLTRVERVDHALPKALEGVRRFGDLADDASSSARLRSRSQRAPGLEQLGDDLTARAVSLDQLRFADDAGRLLLSDPVGVRWVNTRGNEQINRRSVSPDQRCAALALVGGLRAIDLLPLEPVRQRSARRVLLGLLGELLLHRVESHAVIAGAVHGLLSNDPTLTPTQQAIEPSVASWPPFTAVVGALDRYVGPGGAELSAPVEVGTWVMVGGPMARSFGSAGVVRETETKGAWNTELRRGLRSLLNRYEVAEGRAVLLGVPGAARLARVTDLRTPPCARLLGTRPTRGSRRSK